MAHPDTHPRANAETYAEQRAIIHNNVSRLAHALDVHPDDFIQMLGEFQASAQGVRNELYGASPTN
ncbi:MAG: hypothetical protein DI569_12845 [Sphingopyxis macrogoltabida]|uniref:Uncharacterized protein n=1 Tax=Sphingopyxis macrogoltabida TaxID=33050 RepID=A0A2W5MMK6_SPHMC|nr:MAG: hypothetical protein DI569_12845 [Sphingopyxis macrogoltabida]